MTVASGKRLTLYGGIYPVQPVCLTTFGYLESGTTPPTPTVDMEIVYLLMRRLSDQGKKFEAKMETLVAKNKDLYQLIRNGERKISNVERAKNGNTNH